MNTAPATELAAPTRYFDQFVEAFAGFDGERIADLFMPPVVMVQGDGSQAVLAERSDIAHY